MRTVSNGSVWSSVSSLKEALVVGAVGRKEQRYWDGQKAVYVVLVGSTVVLPCINRRNVWTDWTDEEEDQQVWAGHHNHRFPAGGPTVVIRN